jgi:DNA repair protein RecN (Recombination protein N)
MLNTLYIENYAIVSKLELDFSSGLIAFTGETGAGKSIIIDALMLVMGDRKDSSVIRPNADKCEIHACFTFDIHSEPAQWLSAHDLEPCEEIWLRRVITAEGRSKSYINGQPFPIQKIKELSELLVDIHGQHQHQRLLHPTAHRIQLDEYAHHVHLLSAVRDAYQHYITLEAEKTALMQQSNHQERIHLLNYQIDELKDLHIQVGEFADLQREHHLLHHAQTYLQEAEQIRSGLLGENDTFGLIPQMHAMQHHAERLPKDNSHTQNLSELLHNAIIQCEEAASEIVAFSRQIQLDPERLNHIEHRFSQLHHVARKYQKEPDELATYHETLIQERDELEQRSTRLNNIEFELAKAKASYFSAAEVLRQARLEQAPLLANAITETIRQLGIPKGIVELKITPTEKIHPEGLEKVEYYVSTNPGLGTQPLSKVASGGELSRISLAIQLITAQKKAATPTLIFDEVDVGIGGATAALVGQYLRKLGERLQVFCVTHQPQVAASAHQQYRVEKHVENDETFSTIRHLTPETRIDEIARMLGGLKITSETRSNAEALLADAAW